MLRSPFPRDARGLIILMVMLHIGLVLFLIVRFTGSPLAGVGFALVLVGTLGWLYWRDRGQRGSRF